MDRTDGTFSLLPFKYDSFCHTRDRFMKDLSICEQEVVTRAEWRSPELLDLTMYYIETPYVATYALHFGDGSVILDYKLNVSFQKQDFQAKGLETFSGVI